MTTINSPRALSLLLATIVVLGTTAGLASAAATSDLTVSIADNDNTIAPGETTTVQIAVANADGGVGAAELGVELSNPGAATITDVTVLHTPGSTDNNVIGGGAAADVKYAFANSPDTGEVTIVEVTLQGAADGSTDVNVVENSVTGNLVVFDKVGAGYTLDTVESATLTVEEENASPNADANDDQTVTAGDSVTLDGTGSSDPNPNDTLNYSWMETTSSGVTLSDADTATPTFTAPDVSSETTLTFELTVTDADGASDTNSVNVTVQPPEAAVFEVSNLQAPATATQGDAIDISADVENTGGQAATKAVEFRVDNDGDGSIAGESAVLSKDVQVDAGASTTVEFTNVDTGALPVGTVTHGVATPDDAATAPITIEEPPEPPSKETTVSLEPSDQTVTTGQAVTYDVVVDSAEGGVGAAEFSVIVDDTSVGTVSNTTVLGSGSTEIDVADDGSSVDVKYAFRDTADTGSVTIAEVTVQGESAGTAGLALGPSDGNDAVLVFDEDGAGYNVTGTNGASVAVEASPEPATFEVAGLSPTDVTVTQGDVIDISATVENTGDQQATKTVEFRVDGTAVASKDVQLDAGESTTVTFEDIDTSSLDLGQYTHGVFTPEDSATATLTVEAESIPPIGEFDDPPTDPDSDGLYEDVNGDGEFNIVDVQALFANLDDETVQNNPDKFDFNQDGDADVVDVQKLFNEVNSK